MKTFLDFMYRLKNVSVGMVLPLLCVFIFFLFTVFQFLIPYLEESLMDKKREMIFQTVSIVHGYFTYLDKQVKEGRLTVDQAQSQAKDYVHAFGYDKSGEQFFWVQNTDAQLLVGDGTSEEETSSSSIVFSQVADLVRNTERGFFDFNWNFGLGVGSVPLISYVRLFPSWQWILGFGVSFIDIYTEISGIIERVTKILYIISAIIGGLLFFTVWKGMRKLDTEMGQ